MATRRGKYVQLLAEAVRFELTSTYFHIYQLLIVAPNTFQTKFSIIRRAMLA